MDKAATDGILTIVQLLAKSADWKGLSQTERDVPDQNVEALVQHDGDDFVRAFLGSVKGAGVLKTYVAQKLAGYP